MRPANDKRAFEHEKLPRHPIKPLDMRAHHDAARGLLQDRASGLDSPLQIFERRFQEHLYGEAPRRRRQRFEHIPKAIEFRRAFERRLFDHGGVDSIDPKDANILTQMTPADEIPSSPV